MSNIQCLHRISTVLIIFLFCSTNLYSKALEDWTLEDVLLAIEEANGGIDSIRKITNTRFIGEIINDEASNDLIIFKRRPNKQRTRFSSNLVSIERGFDGTTAWQRVESTGYDKVVELSREETAEVALGADFDGFLIGPVSAQVQRELLGIERIDRVDYFLIRVTTPFKVSTHYVDSRTFRELKVIENYTSGIDQGKSTVTNFYDLKQFSGIWIAQRIERELSDGSLETILIKEIQMNPGILDFAFKMPEERNPPPEK